MNTYTPERELKILLTKDQYEQLLSTYNFQPAKKQVNTYFDYKNILKEAKSALRIRSTDQGFFLTLKRPLDSITKKEYEYSIPGPKLSDVPTDIWSQVSKYVPAIEDLKALTTFTTYRSVLDTKDGDFCLDKNEFPTKTDYELEYEYKTDHDGIYVLNAFLKPIGVSYEKNGPSKIQRALTD